ncbi:MAG: class I SAM-dependent methyltransferase [Polyangiaceae bacterium]|nr:class I SAM-dependent methyltransferase [Polyangiaceae bacterium]
MAESAGKSRSKSRVEKAPAPPDRALEAGSAAHYEDPAYYTKTYKNRLSDIRYYTDLAAENGGPVLEYGCGNGRIAIPIARSGVHITGVDLSSAMVADLAERRANEPADVRGRITVRRGDMRTVRFKKRFPLVYCTFNAFLHLYTRTDVEAFLARVRDHLAPGGRFVFDISIPEPLELSRDPARAYGTAPFVYPRPGDPSGGVRVKYRERFDYDRLRQVLFVAMEFIPDHGESWMTPLAHRQFYPAELEALLHYNGFEVVAQYGDFDASPLTNDSSTLITHARTRKASR